jgi:hypothetical protein
MQNRLDDLPLGISDMNKLQILKVAGNPLRYPLRRLLETSETEIAPSTLTDNEKEVAVTAELKRFLKTKQPVMALENEKGIESRLEDPPSTVLTLTNLIISVMQCWIPLSPSNVE